MRQIKALASPALSTKAQFAFFMDEFARVKRDVVSRPITGVAAAGAPTINMTNTDGYMVGQQIMVTGGGNSELLFVQAVTAGVSLTTTTNLVNTYTGLGGVVTVVDLTRLITGTATGGATAIPMTDTTGFIAGQVCVIEDATGQAETFTINAVVPNTQLTATANLVNTYTVAGGGSVSVVNGNPGRAYVSMKKPFADAAGSSEFIDCSWDVGERAIVATVMKSDAGAGPVLPYTWAVAVTADVAALQFVAEADGE